MTGLSTASIRISGSGAVTAVGSSAWQSAASWVGGIRRNRRTIIGDICTQPLTLAACPEITAETSGLTRLSALLAAAISDLYATFPNALAHAPVRIGLALPGSIDVDGSRALWLQTLQRLKHSGYHSLLAQAPCQIRSGVTAAFSLLEDVFDSDLGDAPVLLAGVDNLLEPARLRADHADGKLHTASNTQGWIPSEAAGCVLLSSNKLALPGHERALIMYRPAVAHGPRPHLQVAQQAAPDALCEALRGALANAGWKGSHVGRVLCDNDGSTWRAQCHAQARLRADATLTAPDWTPANVTGYIGAACAPVHWALAAQRLRHDQRPPNSLLSCVLDPGTKAAAVALERAPGR